MIAPMLFQNNKIPSQYKEIDEMQRCMLFGTSNLMERYSSSQGLIMINYISIDTIITITIRADETARVSVLRAWIISWVGG